MLRRMATETVSATTDTVRAPEVLVDQNDGVLRVTFNRPGRANSLTPQMVATATDAIETGAVDEAVRVIVLTGAGRVFSGGMDVLGDAGQDHDRSTLTTSTMDALNRLTESIVQAPKPVIAAVNGPVAGVACSLVFAADLVIAHEESRFVLAFGDVGLMPDGGATGLLPATLGRARALQMALLPNGITARQAEDWGLVATVVPGETFDAELGAVVERLAHGPTLAYAQTKKAINGAALPDLAACFDTEREGQSLLFATADVTEGLSAVREKSRPNFTGC